MTREFLERYQGILADIAAIKADKVTDAVQGSSGEFPWGFRKDIPVRGIDPDKARTLERLYKEKAEIELFIEGVEDDTVRAIMRYRVKQGLSWEQVAARMGHIFSAESIKMKYQRWWK
ncbi:MAG: hypothetical protein ACLTOU_06150 [Acutalibacter sp.]|jgi:hypothetical protein